MMRLFAVMLTIACLVTSCSKPPLIYEDTRQASISTATHIRRDRKSVQITVTNSGKFDVFCPAVTSRVIFDDPDSYLEQAEQSFTEVGTYMRPDESRSKTFGGDFVRGAQIRNAVALEDGQLCHRATVDNYCSYGLRGLEEQQFLNWLMERANAKSCADMLQAFSGKKIDLRAAPVITARPLIFMKGSTTFLFPRGYDQLEAELRVSPG